ncbi:autotransporter outer membrane beta-barrel domain-containing protein [Mesorhizobium xinjiangense]|uniref:autotransporter outer membrane beta-barrel domain-containing protein n=1 Tax=Mesorhizobium xinjiangense TaxID=2678685 RepID=UPI0012ED2E21|nr:autotransporter outer membrane beta-barrel domain-containing protein [Mesorhizobium xinjiangense]
MLRHYALALGAALGVLAQAGQAAAQDVASIEPLAADRIAAFTRQKDDAANARTRQLGLVAARLRQTRSARPNGRNAHASSLAVRFTGAGDGAVFDTANHIAPEKERRTDRLAVWFAGDLTVDGARHENARASTLYSNGVLAGSDVRVGPHLLLGNAVGFGFGRTAFGETGSLGTRYLSDTAYGTIFTGRDSYLDLALGAATMDHSTAYDGATGGGRRGGKQVFAGTGYSRSFRHRRLTIRPYGQSRLSWSAFDRSTRSVADGCAGPARQTYRASITAGVSGERPFTHSAGRFRPHADARMEWSRARTRFGARLAGADDIGDGHGAIAETAARLNLTAGVDWTVSDEATLATSYNLSTDLLENTEREQTLGARFSMKF